MRKGFGIANPRQMLENHLEAGTIRQTNLLLR